ncbi:DUF86 domain-containing protein [Agrobacterium sp. SHOUNA12C]|uniref:DUF86 domain-containing protein n=2 Tax=Rhizobium rhizogenes TaxID=359 RepID=B9J7Z0_RHIR8|nr:HepT-like ribonuclease domain-containing protein [Rhizobium rhizogenes]ACM27311.1 conserved hypothetical protein [Rhizobium rhizogenes K84]KAA6490299.1 DUF86 domain-containing protein [Agrobacterium sp. ICMP 7243]MCJ9724694.1 DUF86 domain-containing protein [Agrobacterium sp. BETTINA12B]MCJ9760333.1 DUF86 domain-containing protein [Agrobacterium sp. SHOUNA12C]OCJ05448.1 hypothetical protein A6U85_00160 [Agrobacterium sp. 13-626]OCJ14614.1 hypothetical protein A6U89_21000 [Agrobacterium sp.
MTTQGPVYYLDRMQKAADEACLFVRGMNGAAFAGNKLVQSAVAYSLCVIGAAAVELLEKHPEFEPEHPEVRWNELRDMGKRLLFDEASMGVEDLWTAVAHAVPELLSQLEAIRHWRAEGE